MTQHYTLNTLEVSAWCTKCGKMTPHRVADKRLQYCLTCYDKPRSPAPVKEAPPQDTQQNLFTNHQ